VGMMAGRDKMPGDKMPGDKSSGYHQSVQRTDDNSPPFQRWVRFWIVEPGRIREWPASTEESFERE